MSIQDGTIKYIKKMKYNSYTTEDFLNDETFQAYALGTSKEHTCFWINWLSENPKKNEEASKALEIITSFSIQTLQIDKSIYNEDFQKLQDAIDTKRNFGIPVRQKQLFLKIAASIILVLGIGYVFQVTDAEKEQEMESVTLLEKSNPKGRKSTVMLPDGSKVKLNSESHLKYEEFDNKRVVELSGEAFFEVAKNPSKPFTVYSKEISTTALGTSFNVRSYPEDLVTQVYLKSGEVEVVDFQNAPNEKLLLLPGNGAEYNTSEKSLTQKKFDSEIILAWNDNIIKFINADFKHVQNVLERWYGVEMEVKGKPDSSWRISGAFKNESLENVLSSIDFTAPLEYTISNNKVKINF